MADENRIPYGGGKAEHGPTGDMPLLNGVPIDTETGQRYYFDGKEYRPYEEDSGKRARPAMRPSEVEARPSDAPYEGDAAAASSQSYAEPYVQQPYQQSEDSAQPYGAPYAEPYSQPHAGASNDQPYGAPYAQPYGSGTYAESPFEPEQRGASKGLAIASLAFGIVAILSCTSVGGGILFGIIAIVLAVAATRHGKDGRATAGKVCGIVGLVLSVVLFVAAFAATVIVEGGSSSSDDYDYDDYSYSGSTSLTYPADEFTPEQQAIVDLITERLDELCAMNDDQLAALGAEMDETFAELTSGDLTFADIGVDPTEVARWAATDMTYELDYLYLNEDDGTGYVSAYVHTRDYGQLLTDFFNELADRSESGGIDDLTSDAGRAVAGQIFASRISSPASTYENFILVDISELGGTWAIDEDSWQNELEYIFWLF